MKLRGERGDGGEGEMERWREEQERREKDGEDKAFRRIPCYTVQKSAVTLHLLYNTHILYLIYSTLQHNMQPSNFMRSIP